MLNVLWLVLTLSGLAFGCSGGDCTQVTRDLFAQATEALKLGIDLAALVAFWFGVSRLAEASGVLEFLGGLVRPLLRPFFRAVPKDHPVLGHITLNFASNLLGLGSAATPFGLKAMQGFKEISGAKDEATPDMVTFLVLNSATVNLVPAGMIALRAATGSHDPAAPYLVSVLATLTSFIVGMTVNALVARRRRVSP